MVLVGYAARPNGTTCCMQLKTEQTESRRDNGTAFE